MLEPGYTGSEYPALYIYRYIYIWLLV